MTPLLATQLTYISGVLSFSVADLAAVDPHMVDAHGEIRVDVLCAHLVGACQDFERRLRALEDR